MVGYSFTYAVREVTGMSDSREVARVTFESPTKLHADKRAEWMASKLSDKGSTITLQRIPEADKKL